MVRRHELTDAEWELIEPLLPRPATGRPRHDDRRVLNGIVWKIRTGVAWRDVPERYGPWQSLSPGSGGGRPMAPSPACSPRRRPAPTPRATSTGW
ncbi:Mobile element protein [Carbonactinospora thermoautotrophica]|uniref:Mobile element protein n=1 Tax=Carbonactinospora thermoautotrophica TaxID=1469144 RepID=A0A132MN49_9ACTN|nr:Mobile element protein [Carbonactinospora thermoautotrophica]